MPAAIAIAFPELWPAIAIVLVLYAAAVLLARPLADLLSNLPVVGEWVASTVYNALSGVVNWAAAWATWAVTPFVQFLSAPVIWLTSFVNGVVWTFDAIAYQLGLVSAAAAGAIGTAAQRIYDLATWVGSIVGWVQTIANTVTWLSGELAWVQSVGLPAAIDAAEAWAAAQLSAAVASVEAWALSEVGAVAAAIRAELAAAVAGVSAVLDSVAAAIRAELAAATAMLTAAVVAVETRLGVRLDGLEGALGTLLSILAPVLALDLARAWPALRARIDDMERECVQPTCSVIKPQLDVLGDLLAGTSLAVVLAFVESAVNDPAGTARATASEAGGLASAANSTLGGLAGIRL